MAPIFANPQADFNPRNMGRDRALLVSPLIDPIADRDARSSAAQNKELSLALHMMEYAYLDREEWRSVDKSLKIFTRSTTLPWT